ncbi:MAG TPA: histidinol dehydrogenase [Bacteroidetes bacterium]|nr:histidinol dehydrogenase [Bacteroidota bacterium]
MEIPCYSSSQSYLRDSAQTVFEDKQLRDQVARIIADVRRSGDKALLQMTEKYDGVARETVRISRKELENSRAVDEETMALLRSAADHIRCFHQKELEQVNDWHLSFAGGKVGQKIVPLQRAGMYVPGGSAVYPSSVLMNLIPARVAGVKEIILVSPPQSDTGLMNPLIIAAASLLGVDEVYAAGGAQAIAALAYGTETIRPVDKIIGPGNRYVAEAKRQVFGKVGIDSVAGPSEIVILADETANPVFIAADLLSQAEHDEHARAMLISTEEEIITQTKLELRRQLIGLSRRSIARAALQKRGALILVNHLTEGIDLVNKIAPEHLLLQIVQPERAMENIIHAGAVFLGHFTPESVGDYWAGSNHVLPTNGGARFSSALSVRDFLRWISIVQYDENKLLGESEKIVRFAHLEGLAAHANAVLCRLTMKRENRE